MPDANFPVPHLTTAHCTPLYELERLLLNQVSLIESWFRQQWQTTPPPLTSSVDLRNAGFKLAPVDTNLFPAGFNNLNPDFLPLCVQAVQSALMDYLPGCQRILLLPENHTRNQFYLQSLNVLKNILTKAGFVVRLGRLDPTVTEAVQVAVDNSELLIEPLIRRGNRVGLQDFDPCLLILNNDLSNGIPEILANIDQPILPTAQLGWANRLKSTHFHFFEQAANEFATLAGLDPWLINPYSRAVRDIDFMAQLGFENLAEEVQRVLDQTHDKYKVHGIKEKPFAVIKADNGTYGIGVLMVHSAEEIFKLNRKQRSRLASSKGSRKIDKVIVQEGVYTFETMPNGAVAEPVVYMIGQYVVGGFYRVHQHRGIDENLNAPGMHFEPLAFANACNMPCDVLTPDECPNRFYVYGVIARLAALAAAREIKAVGGN